MTRSRSHVCLRGSFVLTVWEADDFLHSGQRGEIAEKLVRSLIVVTLVHFWSQCEAGALGMCCDTPLHDARWPAAATCATFQNGSPNTLKSLCTLLGLDALNFQEKQLKALLKAPTNTFLQAYQAAFKWKKKKKLKWSRQQEIQVWKNTKTEVKCFPLWSW